MSILKYWSVEDFEISSHSYQLYTRVNKKFKASGSDDTGLCTYTYNELGYRGESIHKSGYRVMSIGCSNTEGVGVNDNETWPSQFCSHIPNSVNLNFGTGGRSNDFIVRCLLTYYDLIKPDLVLIMYTSLGRKEIYTKNGNIEPYMPTSSWGWCKLEEEGEQTHKLLTELQNDYEDFNNWYKNHLLIKYFLESKKCNWLWNGFFGVDRNYKEHNRFDSDYIDFLDYGVDGKHPGPLHNKTYGYNLYNYIVNNFPHFLEQKNNFKSKII